MKPEIRFCTAADGARIAYTEPVGDGPPLLAVSGWACNAEFELRHPQGGLFYDALAAGRPTAWVIPRGVGGSERAVSELSLDALVWDVETVVERLKWPTFDMWGESSGNLAVASYAVRHPETVSRIVFWSASATREYLKPESVAALSGLMLSRWWLARRAVADIVFPSGPIELHEWYAALLEESIAPEVAARYLAFHGSVDLRPLLPQVRAPVLLLHRRDDHATPIDEGRAMAALLPNARFVALDGDIGFPCFGDTSFVETVRQFLDEDRCAEGVIRPEGMTSREVEVLRLVAAGRSNRQIAEELSISINTVDRHVSNILTKIGATNRAEAASFAVRNRLA
jgi:DNA-binding CsgD family transcriptional regulator/pimeloyl-ACP methyl ester carboxylesterase